jgi:membrane-associated protein
MFLGLNLTEVIHAIGILGIAAIVFAESGMMVGFFLPGDTLLFTAGFLAQQGVLGVNIHALVLILCVAAVLGDNIGYLFGHKVGRKLFKRPDSVLFSHQNLQRAEKFYERWGVLAVVIARFIPVVRTFAPVVAGIGNMPYKKFLLFDIIGGILWTGSVTYTGFYGGAFLESHGINVEALVVPVILVAILFSAGSPLVHIFKDPKSRKLFLRRFGIGEKPKS